MMKHALSLPAVVLAAALAACQASPPPTSAEIEAVAMHARQAGDHKAERRVRGWASKDMPVAERELALIYQARPERRADALPLFEQAARAGDTEAAFELGQMLRAAAPEQAWPWYRQAAQQGHAKAALMLGLLAANGEGVPKDQAEAARWLDKSSALGNAHAMFLLYNAYREGRGVARDPAKGRELLEEAAHHEYPPAIQELAMTLQADDALRAGHLMKEATEHRHNNWNRF
ncbi:tetratricopeptide repeat protein [Janthinobacterium sp. SUN118]|uniref:tetratricopeptide repeat protein n=1 Tax=Janthinobacterium sp. SUN118 TaxID=3004100 RepID=UPI0025AEFE7E|nr:tetratricopeptide repeat protein [Janthinobacterium sp. SUN118]MDN2710309.1 tetratricopeptide repeat protein [Janthinobacterium sp. SUN118]